MNLLSLGDKALRIEIESEFVDHLANWQYDIEINIACQNDSNDIINIVIRILIKRELLNNFLMKWQLITQFFIFLLLK